MQVMKVQEIDGFSTYKWLQRQCWRKGYGSLLQTETEELTTYKEIMSKSETTVVEVPVMKVLREGKREQV